MTEKTLVLEKRDYHSHNRRVCLVTPDTDNKTSTSFLMPEVILIPPFIPDRSGGLRSSLRDVTMIRSAKTVHFNVPLAETLYFHHYQDDEDEESRFEDAFLDFYTKQLKPKEQLHIIPPLPSYYKTVYLEGMEWHDQLYGTIVVDNLGYQKDVMVRVTLDDWKTHLDINAQYKESIDYDYDRFSFSILIPDQQLLSLTCRLAIQYIVNGDCYWDNNNAKNYTIRWLL